MSTVRIWSSAERVANEYTHILREYLRSMGYPDDIIEACELRVNRRDVTIYFHTDDERFYDYEYGDEDVPPLGGLRKFFFMHQAQMVQRVSRLISEEFDAVFIQ